MSGTLSRRAFLLGLGAALPAAAAATGAAASLVGAEEADSGVVATVTATGTKSLEVEVNGVRQQLVAVRGARISRGPVGPLMDFASFVVGDRIVVEGIETSRVWTATSVGTAFDGFIGQIDAIDSEAETIWADGRALDIRRLTPRPGRLGRSQIEVGQHVAGLTWHDPSGAVAEAVLVVTD